MGRVFRPAGGWVLGFVECVGHVSGHGDVYKLCIVIPFESDTAVESICTVLRDLIFYLGGCDEVLGISFLHIFDAKVINH